MARHNIMVVGANNVDITATAFTPLVYGDSNPGTVHTGLGGVGRNIAENLARLGQEVHLLTAFGEDEFSYLAKNQAERIGMDISDSIDVPGAASSTYVCINDPAGEMTLAISDMEISHYINEELLSSKIERLNAAEAVVIDTNLSEEAINFLAQHCTVPIYADSVSAKKAVRLHRSLPRLTGLKANQIEVELLTGIHIDSENDAISAAHALHQMGIEHVFLTLGKRGAFISDGNTSEFAHSFSEKPVNTTGCGDAFFAAAIYAVLENCSCGQILAHGLAGAALCALSPLSVSEQMSLEALQKYFH